MGERSGINSAHSSPGTNILIKGLFPSQITNPSSHLLALTSRSEVKVISLRFKNLLRAGHPESISTLDSNFYQQWVPLSPILPSAILAILVSQASQNSADIGGHRASSPMLFTEALKPQGALSHLGQTEPLTNILFGVLPFLFGIQQL